MIKKVLQPTNDVYIQFTEEELSSIGAGPGTKFETKIHDDGSIELRPYISIELDMADWPKEVLEMIIKMSCEEDIYANDVINKLLKESLENEEVSDEEFFSDVTKCSYEDSSLKSLCGCSSSEAVLPTASNSNYTTATNDMITSITKDKFILNESGNINPNFTNNDTSICNT